MYFTYNPPLGDVSIIQKIKNLVNKIFHRSDRKNLEHIAPREVIHAFRKKFPDEDLKAPIHARIIKDKTMGKNEGIRSSPLTRI